MKNCVVLLVLTFVFSFTVQAKQLEIGQQFPLEKLSKETKKVDNSIVVFIPTLTEDCEYASMLTQSFYYYFDQKLAFQKLSKTPETQIFFVVADKINAAKSVQNIIGKMNVLYDEKGEFFKEFEISQPSLRNADSTVILLDSSNKIALIDKNYRSQGEHLKPLENKLKELNGIKGKVSVNTNQKELKVGDIAPDFQINETQKLSNLRGKVVLLSFYPAAFSGVLPKSNNLNILSNPKPSDQVEISCAVQIEKLDLKFPTEEAKRIVISSSTNPILFNWQKALNTQNIIYANDADYSTSLKYGSYNPNGYNDRVSVIIDRKGKIAYIDKSFEAKDEEILNKKLDELLKK